MAATSTQSAKLDAAEVEARVAARRGDGGQRSGNGNAAPGSRLADAFEAVERFPVLIESRERVIAAATDEQPRVGELVEAVESDVSLTISVLRFANRSGLVAGGVAS